VLIDITKATPYSFQSGFPEFIGVQKCPLSSDNRERRLEDLKLKGE
jgi:hypothetical protein